MAAVPLVLLPLGLVKVAVVVDVKALPVLTRGVTARVDEDGELSGAEQEGGGQGDACAQLSRHWCHHAMPVEYLHVVPTRAVSIGLHVGQQHCDVRPEVLMQLQVDVTVQASGVGGQGRRVVRLYVQVDQAYPPQVLTSAGGQHKRG